MVWYTDGSLNEKQIGNKSTAEDEIYIFKDSQDDTWK